MVVVHPPSSESLRSDSLEPLVKRLPLFLLACLVVLLTVAGAPAMASTRNGLRVEADTRSG